jgi:hypothetical protein
LTPPAFKKYSEGYFSGARSSVLISAIHHTATQLVVHDSKTRAGQYERGF